MTRSERVALRRDIRRRKIHSRTHTIGYTTPERSTTMDLADTPEIAALRSDRRLQEKVARRIADREVGKHGALPFADTSWAFVDKHEWMITAADVIDVVAEHLAPTRIIPPGSGE